MIILGIDPGIARVGWAVVEVKKSQFTVKNFGCVETNAKTEHEKRLLTVHDEVSTIIKKYKPDAVSVEKLFFNTNAKTAFAVGEGRGVAVLAASEQEVPVFMYTPLQIKIAVTGYGRADKRQVGQMVKTILKLKTLPKLDDTTDALAVAITHSFSAKISALK